MASRQVLSFVREWRSHPGARPQATRRETRSRDPRDEGSGRQRVLWRLTRRCVCDRIKACRRSEEHTSELQSLMRISYAVFCLKKKNKQEKNNNDRQHTTPITTLQNTPS